MSVTVADLEAFITEIYPPELAEDWDKVGLICGDRTDPVSRVLVATDPVRAVVDEALEWGAQFILTHHPLYLSGASFLPAQDPKGNTIHRLIRGGCALMNAHTNADSAEAGVAHALAQLIGLNQARVLVPNDEDARLGLGRIGTVKRQSLDDFARHVAAVLPASAHGILVGGDLAAEIETVAVSGGSGDSFLGVARAAGADVYLTADLRHHPASEHLEGGKPYLIAGSHWATESPWVPWAVAAIADRFPQLQVRGSQLVTEPWNAHYTTTGGSQ